MPPTLKPAIAFAEKRTSTPSSSFASTSKRLGPKDGPLKTHVRCYATLISPCSLGR